MLSLNPPPKNTGIFTVKARVVACSVATHWHYDEVSEVTVSAKTILSLQSKGVGRGEEGKGTEM